MIEGFYSHKSFQKALDATMAIEENRNLTALFPRSDMKRSAIFDHGRDASIQRLQIDFVIECGPEIIGIGGRMPIIY